MDVVLKPRLGNQNAVKYQDIHHDEVNYWYDILQNNTIDNISSITKIGRDKVRQILDNRFNKKVTQCIINHANN